MKTRIALVLVLQTHRSSAWLATSLERANAVTRLSAGQSDRGREDECAIKDFPWSLRISPLRKSLAQIFIATTLIFPTSFLHNHIPTASAIETINHVDSPAKDSRRNSEETALDEIAVLIEKYFIDRSFNGQDWNQVRQMYHLKAQGATRDDQIVKLATEMVNSLGDKYSRILDPNSYAAIQKFDLIGVGVTLMPNESKQIIVGAPPIRGSAAERAGLKAGDFVMAVNGEPTSGRTSFDIIDQISDQPNARFVTMSVRPSGISSELVEVTMERQFNLVGNPIQYKLVEDRHDRAKVGYIRISEFNSLVKGKLEEALTDLEANGASAYVLDLRGNTGGAFQSAVEISSLFMEDRVATYVVDGSKFKIPFRTARGKQKIDPDDLVVIWIDGRTASASEVLAGSLHDNCRAVLVGERSFGKGLIQAVYGLKNGGLGLILTVARYVTPAGEEIQGVGIEPDIILKKQSPLKLLPADTSDINFSAVRNVLARSSCAVNNF